MRNRTMALLTNATIIVEAGERSGTWQATEALRLGRMLVLDASIEIALKPAAEMLDRGARVFTPADADRVANELRGSEIRIVRSVQLGEALHGCSLCLLADAQADAAPVYAVAVRLNNFVGHWPGGHLVTAKRWSDENLRRGLVWRPAAEAEAEFRERLATFPAGARSWYSHASTRVKKRGTAPDSERKAGRPVEDRPTAHLP